MVNNSFLCHFPSHYLFRMNSSIHCLQLMTRMLISSSHLWPVTLNICTWLSQIWHFSFCAKKRPALESLMNAGILYMQTESTLPIFPHCEFCLSSDKCVVTACSEWLAEVFAGVWAPFLWLYQVLSQIFRFQTILLWRWHSKTDCTWKPIPWIFCCYSISIRVPGLFWEGRWPVISYICFSMQSKLDQASKS